MSKKQRSYSPPPKLPCVGVESHAHLNAHQFAEDLPAVIERARDAGVKYIGQVFLSPQKWYAEKDFFLPDPDMFFLMGIHPSEVHDFDETVLYEVRSIIEDEPRIKAVGEIGLDYYWKESPPDKQKIFFRKQLAIAKSLDLPVVIHCREAENDTFALLEDEGMHGRSLLWHCFGGAPAMARRILDAGWHISIPGTVTFPANTALRDSVAMIPADRLLVETDCPYLAPVPLRGKRNEPAYLGYTVAAMAEARGVLAEDLWKTCGDNGRCFFGL